MRKTILTLLTLISLTACGSEETNRQDVEESSKQTQTAEHIPVMSLSYADYRTTANQYLKKAKTGLQIPENAMPESDGSGTKNMLHDFSDGLSVSAETDGSDKLKQVRIIWNTDEAKEKADKLSKAATALLAATIPEDRTLERDISQQVKISIESHNKGSDPTRTFARYGIAYKITVTNLPSIVLTAKAE